MRKKINLADILRKNPSIDLDEFERNTALLVELRAAGAQKREFRLALPGATRRVGANEVDDPDPRTSNLSGAKP